MQAILRPLVLAAVCSVGVAGPQGAAVSDIPLEKLGKAFLERHCGDASSALACPFDEVLAADYVRLRLGLFEVHYPASFLEDKAAARDLADAAVGLLELQKRWLGWLHDGTEETAAVHADLQSLVDWIGEWRPDDLAKIAKGEERDLLARLPGAKDHAEAVTRTREALASAEVLGFEPRSDTVRIVCCPTRRDFMELVGYVGLVAEPWRSAFWVDGVDQWTQFWIDRTMILAFQEASWEGFDPEFRRGRSMRKLSDTGLVEHVTQRAGTALMNFVYARTDPQHFEEAVALNLAIAINGRCNTVDGEEGISNSGATTQPYERFVPGGNSAGGILPAIPAAPFDMIVENHWRRGGGEDWFKKALKNGQKDGAKRASKDKENPLRKDKLAHFTLEDKNSQRYVVTAPFFGSHANEKPYPPAEFLNDYREFFRSYRAAFVYWLRTQAAGEESGERFGRVLRGLAAVGRGEGTLDGLIEEAYGMPISATDDSTESLEWQFLNWIAKGK